MRCHQPIHPLAPARRAAAHGGGRRALVLSEDRRRNWAEAALDIRVPDRTISTMCDELVDARDTDPFTVLSCHAGDLAKQFLTDEMLAALHDFKRPGGPAFVLLRNLHLDRDFTAADVPTDAKRPASKTTWGSELALLGAVHAAGFESLSFIEESGMELVHQVAPVQGQEVKISSRGRVRFGFHTDAACLRRPFRPEGIGLLGLFRSRSVKTHLAPLDAILNALDARHIDTLRGPFFSFPVPESFRQRVFGGKRIWTEDRAVLAQDGPGDQLEVCCPLHSVQVVANHGDARAALRALAALLTKPLVQSVVLGPGDLLLLSNVACMHGRDGVQGARWLQRTYFRASLDDLREQPRAADRRYYRRFRMSELVLL